jgi:hypothetical protein
MALKRRLVIVALAALSLFGIPSRALAQIFRSRPADPARAEFRSMAGAGPLIRLGPPGSAHAPRSTARRGSLRK